TFPQSSHLPSTSARRGARAPPAPTCPDQVGSLPGRLIATPSGWGRALRKTRTPPQLHQPATPVGAPDVSPAHKHWVHPKVIFGIHLRCSPDRQLLSICYRAARPTTDCQHVRAHSAVPGCEFWIANAGLRTSLCCPLYLR